MELCLLDGDYVPNGFGGFETVTDGEEKLQRALFKLTARRGGFKPMPDVGSRLYMLARMNKAEWNGAARHYADEALYGEPVSVEDITVAESDGRIDVYVRLAAGDSAVSAAITV